jgi:hypothetical protein
MGTSNVTDLSKYKRLFAFGCSFTQYFYPTWADVLYKSMDPAIPFYNLGRSGGGNVFIANRLTEANRKYQFTETDLVVLMWSTYCRLDFYNSGDLLVEPCNKHGVGWITAGNIYTQKTISEEVIKRIGDPNWFMIRDFSIMDLTTTYLESLPCDHIKFMSVPLDFNSSQNVEMGDLSNSIVDTYKFLESKYPMSMFEHMGRTWTGKIKYWDSATGNTEPTTDYHPTPVDYANYLLKCNIPITQESMNYAEGALRNINDLGKTKSNIIKMFSECDQRISNSFRQLW